MKKCENCLSKYKIKHLEYEIEQLQNKHNTITVQYCNKLVVNLLLNDKIKNLEKEINRKNEKIKKLEKEIEKLALFYL
jgi:hypothetical protein